MKYRILITACFFLLFPITKKKDYNYKEYFFSIKDYKTHHFYNKPEENKKYKESPIEFLQYHLLAIEGEFLVTDCGGKLFYIHNKHVGKIIEVRSRIEKVHINPCGLYAISHRGGLKGKAIMEREEIINSYEIDTIIWIEPDVFFTVKDTITQK